MNTAALLPTPAATARPQRGALGVSDASAETAAPTMDDGFAALVASLDADAQLSIPTPPAAQPAEASLVADTADGSEPFDPQSAFAMAALGLLPVPAAPVAPVALQTVASAVTGEVDAPAAESVLPGVLAPLPVPGDSRPPPAVQPQNLPLPQSAPAAADAETAAAAAPAIAAVKAAEPVPESDETTSAAPQKVERGSAGTELPAAAPTAAPLRPVATPALVLPTVALKGDTTQWQQPLLQALGDRLQLQIAARSDQAVIRLEPPMLGRVEIAIRQQAGDLQVRIAASNEEVTRQIQQVSEPLRQSLVQRHVGEVSVQVVAQSAAGREAEARGGAQQQAARDGQQQERQEQQQQRRPGRGLDGGEAASFAADFASMKA
ncbi:flagellar hook-length control protein FliK [Roseateles sp.]|uniref:flagellar hook-length control protein FliK n=1 Tax=Roseateles sp. TaxID=1971397 RepID=UPI0039E99933